MRKAFHRWRAALCRSLDTEGDSAVVDNVITPRTEVKRRKDRARYDRDAIYAIIDEAFCAAVAVSIDGQPHVQPMLHARFGDDLILHGSSKNRLLNHLASGGEACVNITLVDALVLGATIPDHTMNYRSVSIYGRTRRLDDVAEKKEAMRRVFESIAPERWPTLPEVDPGYLAAATQVHLLPLAESVAKLNASRPAADDNPAAMWTGLLPLRQVWGPPEAAPVGAALAAAPAPPPAIAGYSRLRRAP